ncbi:related to NGG1-general transcriptional adaptor or co-activator [Rhynchosporium secalis]|uniref:Related to NGG1-general transcriptional adaptor or co-activator n=1 Tax=Rhynchosporium secalis TaxID=38038 RepID=A0A1E1MCI4_RHYSE|nr:related to NGG1-general transcriptional adaptor or co-activator [Rhynchosporium secalis]
MPRNRQRGRGRGQGSGIRIRVRDPSRQSSGGSASRPIVLSDDPPTTPPNRVAIASDTSSDDLPLATRHKRLQDELQRQREADGAEAAGEEAEAEASRLREQVAKYLIYIPSDDDTISERDWADDEADDQSDMAPPSLTGHLPTGSSQKSTGKKGRDRQSRSRNTTPSLAQPDLTETPYLKIPLLNFQTDETIDSYGSGTSGSRDLPTSKDLEALQDRLSKFTTMVDARGAVCDRGMRAAVSHRKDRLEEVETERQDEERKERLKKDAADEEERGRNKKASKMKKRKDASTAREDRPLTHGAHGLAAQDGSHLPERSSPSRDKGKRKASRERDNDSGSSSLSPVPVAVATPTATGMDVDKDDDDDSSSDEHQPPPAPAVPHLQTFGEDPNTFPDSTVYEIRSPRPGMSREEKCELYSVAGFPEDDLEEFIPDTPPDKDFSNAKPTNQVQANTFASYIEPYFRPFNEEDLAFIRERGDRVQPFIIPRLGKKHYTEVWAEEDGAVSVDGPSREKYPPNQARGDIENMTDAIAETDQISAGPVLSRLLACMRPEHRATLEEKPNGTNGTNGDVDMNADLNEHFDENGGEGSSNPNHSATHSLPPATFMPDSNSEAWKKLTHPKLDHAQVDERLKQELRNIGFMPEDKEPDYDAQDDDDVSARLRHLQAQLKVTALKNGARKAILFEKVKEAMAAQEYNNIREDLDTQTQTAFVKRTRSMGKNKKNKRPGGAGGGSHFVAGGANPGAARPGIGDNTKVLMERRRKWVDTVGGAVDEDASKVRRNRDPDSSIFKPEIMAEYIQREKEHWDEEAEEE